MVTHAAEEVVCGRHNQDSANMQSLGGSRTVSPRERGLLLLQPAWKLCLLSFGAQDVLFLRETLLAPAAVLPYRAGMGTGHGGEVPRLLTLRCAKASDWERLRGPTTL